MSSGKKIFISYAAEDRELAYRISLSLRDHDLDVFFDRDELQPGGGYDKEIRQQILQSSAFVFLVSKHSVTPGRYTLTELQFARDKWPHPKERVLPVGVGPTGKIASEVKDLMSYVNAVSILRPKGSAASEVSAKVVEMIERTTLVARFTSTFNDYCGDFLKFGAGKSLALANAPLDEEILRKHEEDGGRISVGELKANLNTVSILRNPRLLTVTGHFFPSTLLSFGWWEKVKEVQRRESEIKWKDPVLQRWLFSGFEEWAPSWDVNDWSSEKPFKLIGQIGEYDEADSIPVLIKSERKARELRSRLMDRLVANANVRGVLCHESHLRSGVDTLDENESAFLESMRHMNSKQDYFLILLDDDRHGVEILSEKVDFYSGYIWQVWAPKEWVSPNPYETLFQGAYFIWEHTNLAQREVLKYSLDSRDRKVEYLRRRVREHMELSGELVLLQHLMPERRLRGDKSYASVSPAIPSAYFRDLFAVKDESQVAA